MSFHSLGLSAELLRAVKEKGYSEPTPIQRQAIPLVLEGRDLLAAAQTGTGKTAGFTLPILHRLQASPSNGGKRRVRALILTPTRELAAQVAQSVQDYGQHLPVRAMQIFGGVSINPQIATLRKGVDIVIATPGRLLDHLQQRTVDLSAVEMLVLDEADRMLDMGFIRDIRRIFKLLPEKRQTLLFSATFSDEIRRLAGDILHNPCEVQVAPANAAADRVKQVVHMVDKRRKRELLSHRIGAENWRQVLVFTRTKHGANRLAEQLTMDGLHSMAIHGNKSQTARTKALAEFKAGKVRVLVATDIAARGLDIQRLPHVVNYDLPAVAEDYVHRIGRTARAGEEGTAVSLVSSEEKGLLRDIERLLKCEIEKQVLPGYEPGSKPAVNQSEQPARGAAQNAARPGKPNNVRRFKKPGSKKRRPAQANGNANGNRHSGSRRQRRAG